MINFTRLRAFHEAAKTQNFSAAARSLRVSQPAVTAHVRALEESLGVKLFRKRGRRVVLTDTGALLYRYSQEVFELERQIERAMHEILVLERGTVKVGTTKTYAQWLMPQLVTRFHAAFPKVRMVLDEGSSLEIAQSLLELRNDLAVIAQLEDFEGLRFVPFRRERVVLCAAPAHPLAQGGPIEFGRLKDELVIMQEEGSGIEALVRRSFARRGLSPNVLVESSNVEFIKEMVERGDAVSFLVETMIAGEIEGGVITTVPIMDQALYLDVSIAYVDETELSPAAAAFLEMLLGEAAATTEDHTAQVTSPSRP